MRFSRVVWVLPMLALLLSACGKAEPTESTAPKESEPVAVAVDVDEFFDNLIEAQLTQTSYFFETRLSGEFEATVIGMVATGDTMADFAMAQEVSTVVLGESFTLHQILVDDMVYVGVEALTGDMFVAQPLGTTASDELSMTDMRLADVLSQQWELMRPTVVSVRDEGYGGNFGDGHARKYALVIDHSASGEESGDSSATGGAEESTVQMWVGTDGLIRRMVMDDDGVVDDTTWYGWGEPVTISAPPADFITDEWTLDELLGE